jgi:hypothetical protein
MGDADRVVSLFARKQAADAELDKRLEDAYRRAKAADDGRRVARKDLVFAERREL